MPEALANVYASERPRLLRHVAEILLFDWKEANVVAEEARRRLDARQVEGERGRLLGAVAWAFTRAAVDRAKALGYQPPLDDHDIQAAGQSDEWAAAERAERAQLAERIETLPASFREPVRAWLAGLGVQEADGWRVRVALTLLGRRRAAA